MFPVLLQTVMISEIVSQESLSVFKLIVQRHQHGDSVLCWSQHDTTAQELCLTEEEFYFILSGGLSKNSNFENVQKT